MNAFNRDGIQGTGASLIRRWSRVYNLEPIYTARFTLNTINAYDTTYAPHLFNQGRVTTISTMLGVERRTLDWNYECTFTADAGAPTPLADFNFTRFTIECKADRRLGAFRLNFRSLAGGMWSTGSIPSQERFTVSAAGSMAYYHRPYLSAKWARNGLPWNIQKRYHLPGDGNLRGYYDHGYYGVESLVTTTTELSRSFSLGKVGTLEARLFLDGGVLWGDRLEEGDQGFDGDVLIDAGLGIEWSKRLFRRPLYLRVDLPFYVSVPREDGTSIDFTRWVFSFQRGL
jgi:hemolysin activation/secretion protein